MQCLDFKGVPIFGGNADRKQQDPRRGRGHKIWTDEQGERRYKFKWFY